MNRKKNIVRSISWGLVNKAIAIFLPFLSRTVLLYKLGTEYVGLQILFTSVIGLLSLSELGIGTALVYSMYEPMAHNDTSRVCSLLNLYKKCYRIIGVIVAVLGVVMLPFLPNLLSGDYPNDINIYSLYLIYLANTVLSYFLFAYKKSIIVASQRVDIQSNINSVVIVTQNLLQFTLVLAFSNYYLYALVLPICTLIENISVNYIVNRFYPQYRAKGRMKFSDLPEIKTQIVGLLMQRIGTVVLSSADSLVISSFLGLYILGQFNNYHYIITALFGLLVIVQTSLKPIVGNSIVMETKEKNLKDFYNMNFLYIWVVTWMAASLFCLYQPFMLIWVGEKNLLSNEFVLLMTINFFVHKWGDMLFVYQEAAGIWWKTKYIPLTAAILNIIINIVTVKLFGVEGITFGTIVSILVIYDFGYAKILFNEYFGKENFNRYQIRSDQSLSHVQLFATP